MMKINFAIITTNYAAMLPQISNRIKDISQQITNETRYVYCVWQ